MKTINQEYRNKIQEDELLVAKIAQATNRKVSSVNRWLKEGHPVLANVAILEIVSKELGIKANTILMDTKVTNVA